MVVEVAEVVDRDDLDVGAGSLHGAEEVAADPAEAVDAHANGHGMVSSSAVGSRRLVAGVTPTLPGAERDHANGPSEVRAGNSDAVYAARRRRACPGVRLASVSGMPEVLRRACPPSPAAGGSGPRSRPW